METWVDTGGPLRERYGTPRRADPDAALRQLGLRDKIHPHDVVAFMYTSMEACRAFADGNLEHHGHPDLGCFIAGDGVIGVTDIRHALRGTTDPAEPSHPGKGCCYPHPD